MDYPGLARPHYFLASNVLGQLETAFPLTVRPQWYEDREQLRNHFRPWSSTALGAPFRVNTGLDGELALIIGLISHRLEMRQFNFNSLNIDPLNSSYSEISKDHHALVRGWLGVVCALAPLGNDSSDISEAVAEVFETNMATISAAYPGIDGLNKFVEDTKGSHAEPYAGALLARLFADEVDAFGQDIGTVDTLMNTRLHGWFNVNPFPHHCFNDVDSAVFSIHGFWDRFADEANGLLCRDDDSFYTFGNFLNVESGFVLLGMSDRISALCKEHNELEAMLSSRELSLEGAICLLSPESALRRLQEHIEDYFGDAMAQQRPGLISVMNKVHETVGDKEAFARILYSNKFARPNGKVSLVTALAKRKTLFARKVLHGSSFDAFVKAVGDEQRANDFLDTLQHACPDTKALNLAVNFLATLYEPLRKPGSMDPQRHERLIGSVIASLERDLGDYAILSIKTNGLRPVRPSTSGSQRGQGTARI